MLRAMVIAIAFGIVPALGAADGRHLWQGGLWNLDYPGDVSTYGYFRLSLERDISQDRGQVLRVEWVERLDGNGERVYANRLIPELGSFVDSGLVKIEMAPEIPSAIRLQNAKGRVLWLRLWEPTRFAIQKKLK
jgi:hypothetical protein